MMSSSNSMNIECTHHSPARCCLSTGDGRSPCCQGRMGDRYFPPRRRRPPGLPVAWSAPAPLRRQDPWHTRRPGPGPAVPGRRRRGCRPGPGLPRVRPFWPPATPPRASWRVPQPGARPPAGRPRRQPWSLACSLARPGSSPRAISLSVRASSNPAMKSSTKALAQLRSRAGWAHRFMMRVYRLMLDSPGCSPSRARWMGHARRHPASR